MAFYPQQLKLCLVLGTALNFSSVLATSSASAVTMPASTSQQPQVATSAQTANTQSSLPQLLNFTLDKFSMDGLNLTAIVAMQQMPILIKAMLDGLDLSDISYDQKTGDATINLKLEQIKASGTQLSNSAPVFNANLSNIKVKSRVNYLDPINNNLFQLKTDQIVFTPLSAQAANNMVGFKVQDLAVNGSCHHTNSSNSTCKINFSTDQISTNNMVVGPVIMDIFVQGDRSTMNAYGQTIAALSQQANLTPKQAQARLQNTYNASAGQDFEAGISKFYIETTDGPITASFNIKATGTKPGTAANFTLAFQASVTEKVAYQMVRMSKFAMENLGSQINGKSAINAWKTPIPAKTRTEIAQTLEQWVQKGLIVKNGHDYTVTLLWNGSDNLILNGKKFQPQLSLNLKPVPNNGNK